MLIDEGDYAIVQGIIALAKTFGRKTAAEGVEELGRIQVLLGMDAYTAKAMESPIPCRLRIF